MDIKFYSLEEIPELFGVNCQLVCKPVKSGELPSVRIGKIFRGSAPRLKEYMERQSQRLSASGVTEHICSRCGRKYFSKLSISESCKRMSCATLQDLRGSR